MRKLISYINITPDGFCDHTAVLADEELHASANQLFRNADTGVFGRVTYQLMESYWPSVAQNPTGIQSVDEFAVLLDNIEKIVFSRTMKSVEWQNARLATGGLEEEIVRLKKQPGKDMVVSSPSLISQLTRLELIDEYYFLVQPILAGSGKRFFETVELDKHHHLELTDTEVFTSGTIKLCYKKRG
ncbi:MAG: dihydrofolate reductase family protein [Chlorobi bacterium]|nr:dihydrofolate reductase family protein [Chlorobiota bacterium]